MSKDVNECLPVSSNTLVWSDAHLDLRTQTTRWAHWLSSGCIRVLTVVLLISGWSLRICLRIMSCTCNAADKACGCV